MGKYFGTDGFRGEAGGTLTAEHAFRIGRVLGHYYSEVGKRPRAVIGKDTRRSSYMLEYAVAAGLSSVGADAYVMHVTTTPGVAYVTRTDGFDIGIMISASHNPYYDNGIKVMNSEGEKLSDAVIEKLEALMDGGNIPSATGADIGRIVDHYSGRNRYVGYLVSVAQHSFRTLKIGLDCANGSAFAIARSVFEALGAEVHTIGCEPNGTNINDGVGSTHIEALSELVRARGLDVGFAFDGDADRCIAVDERGNEVNGDHVLYILALGMKAAGELYRNTAVTTVMSNLGLYRALDKSGISYKQTSVGDRYVYECMKEGGYTLGGEQSGHIIISKYATTGDGILTAIRLTEAMLSSGKPLSALAAPVAMLPQITLSVGVKNRSVINEAKVERRAAEVRAKLGEGGRLLLRASGTEPVVRIMIEAEAKELATALAEALAEVIREEDARQGASLHNHVQRS